MRSVLREPLVHFLALGAALFLVFGLTRETDPPDGRRIVVTAGQVEQLAGQFSRTWLRPPTADELASLVEQHVRSEIFYREALAMGLGEDDPYVRNRLALKLQFVLDDFSADAEPADGELERFLEANAERFAEPARLSFTQVYLNPERHADPVAEAGRVLDALRAGADPAGLGDVSMLTPRFDAATPADIAREFGEAFANRLAELEPDGWSGPIRSPFGLHLVRVSEHTPERQPALDEVRDAVLAEWRDQQRREATEQAYGRLRERYEVFIEPGAQAAAGRDGGSPASPAPPQSGRGDDEVPAAPPPETAQGQP